MLHSMATSVEATVETEPMGDGTEPLTFHPTVGDRPVRGLNVDYAGMGWLSGRIVHMVGHARSRGQHCDVLGGGLPDERLARAARPAIRRPPQMRAETLTAGIGVPKCFEETEHNIGLDILDIGSPRPVEATGDRPQARQHDPDRGQLSMLVSGSNTPHQRGEDRVANGQVRARIVHDIPRGTHRDRGVG